MRPVRTNLIPAHSRPQHQRLLLVTRSRSNASAPRPKHRWQRNQLESPLLRLPPEIRNRIYELVLSVGQVNVQYKPWQITKRRPAKGHPNHDYHATTTTVPGGFCCRVLRARQNPWNASSGGGDGSTLRQGSGPERGMTLLSPVCRQLYLETALLPYKLNAWSFENRSVMERYVVREKRLPLPQRRAINTLYVSGPMSKSLEKFFGGLKVIVWKEGTKLRREVLETRRMAEGQGNTTQDDILIPPS